MAFKIISKMLKKPNFLHSQPSTLPKDAPVRFYLSTTFVFNFTIIHVAPIRMLTFYAYLTTKIGNCNLYVNIVYQGVYHLADQGFIILFTTRFLIGKECSIFNDHKLFLPARPIIIEKGLIY